LLFLVVVSQFCSVSAATAVAPKENYQSHFDGSDQAENKEI
jgi:hypothetical protein